MNETTAKLFYLRLSIPWNEQRKTSFGHKLVRLTSGTAVGFGRFQIQLAHIVALYHRHRWTRVVVEGGGHPPLMAEISTAPWS